MTRLENLSLVGTVLAAAALTRNRFISFTDGVPAAGAAIKGVADDSVAIGQTVGCKVHGWILVEAGAAVAVGAEIETDAQGRAITRNTGVLVGRALDAATAAGQLIRIVR